MWWTAAVGFVVFLALALLIAPEYWSSSRGILKEDKRKKSQAPPKQEP